MTTLKARLDALHAMGLTGADFVTALQADAHNAPGLPDHAWDGDDPDPLLARLDDRERERFGLAAAQLAPPLPAEALAPPVLPVYKIRVHVICCANNDGTQGQAKPADVRAWMPGAVAQANAIYAERGAGIEFTFNPLHVETRNDTLLNQDFTVPAGTNMVTPEDKSPLDDDQLKAAAAPHETHRNKVCLEHPGRCVFLLCHGTQLVYDKAQKRWTLGPRTGYAYSWANKEFVNFPASWGALRGPEVSHETGHFFHLWHTHVIWKIKSGSPKTAADAAADIVAFVDQGFGSKASGLNVFDGDRESGVNDTPPDPGPNVYLSAADPGTADPKCGVSAAPKIKATFGDGTSKTYTPATDRGCVMSYFKGCSTFQQHFTHDQILRMRAAIETGNRRRLVATALGDTAFPNLRYGATWNASTTGQVWWPLCSEAQLRDKTAALWGAMRFRQMLAVPQDDQIRYACLWDQGTHAQVWWPNCSEQQFRDKTSELWPTMRPAQIHPFMAGDSVRFACLWNGGTQAQVWWPLCTEAQLRAKTAEVWATMRLRQMLALEVDGTVYYACLWDAGTHAQVWWPNCSEQQFRDKTSELWPTMRPAQIQPFRSGGGLRFSCLWNAGTQGQVWWPVCTEEQVREKTDDLWQSSRPAGWWPVAL